MNEITNTSTDNSKFLFAIHDSVSNEFNPPVTFSSVAVAVRFFGDLCKKDPVISAHPGDFSLHWIGSFNCSTGIIVSLDTPSIVAKASDFFPTE